MGDYDSQYDTREHIATVKSFLRQAVDELRIRACTHDASKLEQPEKSIFDTFTPKLKHTAYGSEQYKEYLDVMKVALDHHYKNNRHHPEHFENGIKGMTLIDLVEMVCDWMAATKRHADGDIQRSIGLNQERFGYSDELREILLNTVAAIETEKGES